MLNTDASGPLTRELVHQAIEAFIRETQAQDDAINENAVAYEEVEEEEKNEDASNRSNVTVILEEEEARENRRGN